MNDRIRQTNKLMTQEAFLKLAMRPPVKERDTLFVLTQVCINDLPPRKRQHYPEYTVRIGTTSYHRSLADAEHEIEERLHDEWQPEIYCFYIREYPYSVSSFSHENISCRVYDANGRLLLQTRCSNSPADYDDNTAFFYGRPIELTAFKPGDIVEILEDDTVSLATVIHTPCTPDEVWKHRMRGYSIWQKRFVQEGKSEEEIARLLTDELIDCCHPDYSDDSYLIATGPGFEWHSHPHITEVFAPHFPVPNHIRRKLNKYYEKTIRNDA